MTNGKWSLTFQGPTAWGGGGGRARTVVPYRAAPKDEDKADSSKDKSFWCDRRHGHCVFR